MQPGPCKTTSGTFVASEQEGDGGEQGWGGILSLLSTELACVCNLHPLAPAPLLCYQEQVCATNEGLQVLRLSCDFVFHS